MGAIDWEKVRYPGDAADVQELFETYRIAHYLTTFEENRRQQEENVRNKLLAEGIRLTERLSPRIYGIFHKVNAALDLQADAEVFCLRDENVNAMAILEVTPQGFHSLVGLTSGALERLEDDELASVIGHELGHFLYQNNRLNALLSTDAGNPSVTVLPPLGESLFLRWRKKAEISSDRVGLLASRNFVASARGLIKAAFGLSERNLNLDVGALLAQIDELKGQPELMSATFASHPLLAIRLKALELFSRSLKANQAGYPVEQADLLPDAELESQVDELLELTRRHPTKPLHLALMQAVALGGIKVLSVDGEISDYEIKLLIHILQHYLTDEPEKEILTDQAEIERRLPEVLALVKQEGSPQDKTFVLSRLTDVALADGALMDKEGAVIMEIAQQLDIGSKLAYSILVGAAQSVGFKVDFKLNRVADNLRRSLHLGLGLTDPGPSSQ